MESSSVNATAGLPRISTCCFKLVFFLSRPTAAQIESVLKVERTAAPSYSLSGTTRDYHCVRLGSGDEVFQAAKRTLKNWKMMDLGWLCVVVSGRDAAIVVRHYGFWSVNVARVLRVEETGTQYSMTYATLPEHAEAGEENFTVSHRPDDSVWYEIEAFSRPRHWLAKLGYPLTRMLQKRFARDSMRRMQRACS